MAEISRHPLEKLFDRLTVLSLASFMRTVLLIGLALTPVFNIGEIYGLFKGSLESQSQAMTPVYIKIIKDFIFVVLIGAGYVGIFRTTRIFYHRVFYLFLAAVFVSFLLSVPEQEKMILVAGIRWIIPALLLIFIFPVVDRTLQQRIAKILIVVFLIGLGLQIYQFFFLKYWFGTNAWGLGLRNPGFYLIPSSMAMFTLVTMYYCYHFYRSNRFVRAMVLFFLAPVSIVLTTSGTGMLIMILFYLVIAYWRIREKLFVLMFAVLALFLLTLALPVISGREDIYESATIRMDILTTILKPDLLLFSSRFGDATNTAILLHTASPSADEESSSFIADSTVISLITNSGMLSLVLFVLFLASMARLRPIHLHFLLINSVFMITVIIFELFPANLLLAVNCAYLLKEADPANRAAHRMTTSHEGTYQRV